MVENSQSKLTQFKQILHQHVHGLKSDPPGPESADDLEDNNEELNKDFSEDISLDTSVSVHNETTNTDCLMLCGRILRIMGDEVTCRACGKSLRNIGDEIFCSYATKNILISLLYDLSRNETVDQNAR